MIGQLKNNTIVITGISSFIGIHLAKYFAAEDFEVTGTITKDISLYGGIEAERLKIASENKISLEKLDITMQDSLQFFINKFKPQYWIHHAGWAKNYGSFDYDFEKGFEVNVKPLGILYKFLKEIDCKGIIITGTGAEYSDSDDIAKEEHKCFPAMPYGLCKLYETLYARQLAYQHGIPTRVARVFIPFGVLDNPEKLLSLVYTCFKKNEPVDLSLCEQKRDFLFIDDLVQGYFCLLKYLKQKELFDIFNFSSGKAVMLKDLLLQFAQHLGKDVDLLRFGARPMRSGEPPVSYGSNQKAKNILNWHPEILTKGILSYINSEKVN